MKRAYKCLNCNKINIFNGDYKDGLCCMSCMGSLTPINGEVISEPCHEITIGVKAKGFDKVENKLKSLYELSEKVKNNLIAIDVAIDKKE